MSNIIEYEEKYDTTFGEDFSILWRTAAFQDMAQDIQNLVDRKNIVDSLAEQMWKALRDSPSSVVAYGVGLGKLDGHTLRPDYAKILMDKEDSNTGDLSRVIPDSIPGASRICLPKVTQKDYEKGITSSVQPPLYYCDNAMVISHVSRVKTKQKGSTIVYDLRNINKGEIVGSNKWNNNFLIYPGTTKITGGNNVVNRFVLVNNPSFLGKMIGGTNSINILDLSQLAVNKVTGVIGYHFKPNAYGKLQVRINNRLLIDDYVSNNLFNYHYIGRQNKVDEVLCMGDSEHFTESDNRDVIIDSGGGLDRDRKDVVENCRKVIISPYTTVKGGKSNYTFYVKTAEYKGRGLYSEIDVDGTGTVVFPEFDLLSDCDQITYSKNSNTLSLRINFGQNNQFTLDIRNYVEQSSNKPHFVLIDKNGSNIVPKIERSDSSTIKISSFELHSEYSLGNFDDVETHYKKILNDDKDYKVLSVIRDKTQSQDNSVVPHMVFGSSGDDVINFDQGTMFARGGKGRDMYVIADSIGNKEVKIDNHSDDEKADTLFMPEVEKDFSIQQCDLHLKHNNSNIRVKNYLQDPNYRHLIVMNNKGEAFIPYVQSMSCSSSEKGKLVPFLQATQTQNMFLLPKDFQGDHIVIDFRLEDIERCKDKDDLLLIRERGENEIPFIIRIEGFYTDRSKWENISYSLWNNNDLFPAPELLENVDNIMEYQDKLRDDYKKVVKEYIVDFSNSISIQHNQKLERNILTFVGKDEERIGVMILKNITPDQVEVSSSSTDLIFRDKKSNRMVNIKGWNSSKSYRISTLEFDPGLEPITIRRLDRFSLSEVGKIQDLINQASGIYQKKAELELNKQLFAAIHSCDLNTVKDLVSRGASINLQDIEGKTPLNLATEKGCNDIVEIFRHAQLKLDLDKELVTAISDRNLNRIKDLISRGANVNAKDTIGVTPMHLAVYNQDRGFIELLLGKGADINSTDIYGRTPLFWASYSRYLDMISCLIDRGANINIKNQDGKTALDIARNRGYDTAVRLLEKGINKEREKPAQRKRRHHHGDHDRHQGHLSRKPLAIGLSNQPEIAVSGGARTSSWINDLFGWMKSSVGGLLNPKPEKISSTKDSISQVDAQIDVNGTIMLLDLLIRRVTGQKYISTVDQPISPLEAQGYALNITKGFEKVVEQAGLKSGVSMHRLNIDYMGMQKEITKKVMSGKFNEISGILKSYVEKACPGKEAGKLSSKKFDKFIAQFNNGLLNQSIEQALHNGDGRLEVDDTKQMSLEPQSYLSNASIQSHSKVSTCLSDVGVTKLGGNINR